MIARQIAEAVIAVLLAPPCAACGATLSHPISSIVCDACWRGARTVAPPFHVLHAASAQAAGVYAGALREIVHAFKYQRRTSLARPLAALIAERCADAFAGADAVIPVPLHRSRHRERGFNQAALLARALPLPCVDALVRIRPTLSQTELPADQRRANVRGAFALERGPSHFSLPRHVKTVTVPLSPVLVDDVATTGATLGECARVLREAGAREVRVVTVARAL